MRHCMAAWKTLETATTNERTVRLSHLSSAVARDDNFLDHKGSAWLVDIWPKFMRFNVLMLHWCTALQ
jgi:hypothetical protein